MKTTTERNTWRLKVNLMSTERNYQIIKFLKPELLLLEDKDLKSALVTLDQEELIMFDKIDFEDLDLEAVREAIRDIE